MQCKMLIVTRKWNMWVKSLHPPRVIFIYTTHYVCKPNYTLFWTISLHLTLIRNWRTTATNHWVCCRFWEKHRNLWFRSGSPARMTRLWNSFCYFQSQSSTALHITKSYFNNMALVESRTEIHLDLSFSMFWLSLT